MPLLCCILLSAVHAQARTAPTPETETVEPAEPTTPEATELDSLEVVATGPRPLREGASLELSRRKLLTGMRLFGEADALKTIARQSGVVTAGDYGSGLIIDGNLPSHVLYRIDGVPVYFPYRFGGLFSSFNTGHFSTVDFERGIHGASMPARLGAKLDFHTDRDVPAQFSGSANVGMMASSISLMVPVAGKWLFSLSGRISYINELYGWLLVKKGSSGVMYDFGDLNFTASYHPDDANRIRLNLFGNSDRMTYEDVHYAMDTRISWRNGLLALDWQHDAQRFRAVNRLYLTGFDNNLTFAMPQLNISAPSSLSTAGVSGQFDGISLSRQTTMEAGYEFNYHTLRLQEVNASGLHVSTPNPRPRSHPLDARAYGDVTVRFANGMDLRGGLSLALYANSAGYVRLAVDPRVTWSLEAPLGRFSVHIGRYTQFLHQVGFSQIGLASDFWIDSRSSIHPESSYNLELDYSGFIPGPGLYFSANVYGRRYLHQAELMGEFISIIDSDYDPEVFIRTYNGYAAGANVTLRREFGKLTGSIGVGYGLARNRLGGEYGYVRGRTEPGFTLSAEAQYRFDSHWSASANFRFATGRPYTPVTSLYIVGGNVMKNFGAPNSALLPDWHRLDIGGSWTGVSGPRSHPLRHLVSLALINAYGRRNPEFITYVINIGQGVVRMKSVFSLYRFFPSLSYTIFF